MSFRLLQVEVLPISDFHTLLNNSYMTAVY